MTVVSSFTQARFWLGPVPAPDVTKPNRREQMERRRLRTAVFRGRANQNVVRVRLRILDLDIEIAVLGEGAGVPNFKLAFHLRAPAICCDKFFVGITRLRIAINHPHETVRRRAVDVPIKFLYVFAVISFRAAYAEDAFLRKWIALIPKRERKTEQPFVIANSANAVFVPAIRARPRVIV